MDGWEEHCIQVLSSIQIEDLRLALLSTNGEEMSS